MLDAAHGEGRCPAAMVERVHVVRVQVQIARAELACVLDITYDDNGYEVIMPSLKRTQVAAVL